MIKTLYFNLSYNAFILNFFFKLADLKLNYTLKNFNDKYKSQKKVLKKYFINKVVVINFCTTQSNDSFILK